MAALGRTRFAAAAAGLIHAVLHSCRYGRLKLRREFNNGWGRIHAKD
jgi:hypothetical protein